MERLMKIEWIYNFIDLKYLKAINECIENKNINLILNVAKKSIGKSSVYMTYDMQAYVYLLIKNNEIVYIGHSTCSNRIGVHQKTKDFDSVYFLPFTNKLCHETIEYILIKHFKTKYNYCQVAKKYHYEQDKQRKTQSSGD